MDTSPPVGAGTGVEGPEGVEAPPRWGIGDAVGGLALAHLAAAVGGFAILAAAGRTDADELDDLPLTLIALLQVPLWVGLLGAPIYAAYRKGSGLVRDFGLRMRPADAPVGLGIGVLSQWLLVPLIYLPIFWLFGEHDVSAEARELTDKAEGLGVLLLVMVVIVGAPVVEELFFRGLVLRSLERRTGPVWAVALSSLAFGLVHLQLLQLPALVAFGVVLGVITLRSGRLGPAIWAHVAFNTVTVVSLLAS